jgi:hypothetical protein
MCGKTKATTVHQDEQVNECQHIKGKKGTKSWTPILWLDKEREFYCPMMAWYALWLQGRDSGALGIPTLLTLTGDHQHMWASWIAK